MKFNCFRHGEQEAVLLEKNEEGAPHWYCSLCMDEITKSVATSVVNDVKNIVKRRQEEFMKELKKGDKKDES